MTGLLMKERKARRPGESGRRPVHRDMIANARMYAVSPVFRDVWKALFLHLSQHAGVSLNIVDHEPPAPIEDLWRHPRKAAVFMCGLPFAQAAPRPHILAAPVPALPEFAGAPCYWSEFVVRADSGYQALEDTFGSRIAFTTPGSQSGYAAPLLHLARFAHLAPLFSEVIAPTITPLGALTSVVAGDADVAPLDSYAFRLLRNARPDLTRLVRVIAATAPTPIPPLVATRGAVTALRSAFVGAHRDTRARELMGRLLIRRFVRPADQAYEALRENRDAALSCWRGRPLAPRSDPAFIVA